MAEKSSENENKVFHMTVKRPCKSDPKHGKAWKCGRGEVSRLSVASFAGAFMAMVSFVFLLSIFPLFSLFLLFSSSYLCSLYLCFSVKKTKLRLIELTSEKNHCFSICIFIFLPLDRFCQESGISVFPSIFESMM